MQNWIQEVIDAKALFLTRIGDIEFKVIKRVNKNKVAAVALQHRDTGIHLVHIQNCRGCQSAWHQLVKMMRYELTMRACFASMRS